MPDLIGGYFGYTAVRSVLIQDCVLTVTKDPVVEEPTGKSYEDIKTSKLLISNKEKR